MSYINETLVFESDKVYYVDDSGQEHQVMMSWEDEIMKNLLTMCVKVGVIF